MIWKFALQLGQTSVSVPKGSVFRDIMIQEGQPYIYIEIDASNEYSSEQRTFVTYGTGQQFDDANHKYVGSVQQTDVYGWHVYELAIN